MTSLRKNRLIVLVAFSLLFMLSAACQKTVSGRVIFKEPEPADREQTEYPEYREPSEKGGPPPWAPAHGQRAKYKYRYYPNSSVYYDSERRVYFYYDRDEWHTRSLIPDWIALDKNDYVTIEMDTDRPYKFHSDVYRKYPPGHEKNKVKDKSKWKKDKDKDNDKGKGKGKNKGYK
jgi:hypothetical protein